MIIAVGLVAINAAAMAVRERYREFAVMRAIGFSRLLLVTSILAEGIAIGLTGGLIGCAAAVSRSIHSVISLDAP